MFYYYNISVETINFTNTFYAGCIYVRTMYIYSIGGSRRS